MQLLVEVSSGMYNLFIFYSMEFVTDGKGGVKKVKKVKGFE